MTQNDSDYRDLPKKTRTTTAKKEEITEEYSTDKTKRIQYAAAREEKSFKWRWVGAET